MLSEAILFAITAIDPIGYDYHWEKVFPALVNGEKGGKTTPIPTPHDTPTDVSLSSKLDQMMSRAGIDIPMMERLADGMNRLSQEARSISSISNVKDINAAYYTQMSSATENMERLNHIYRSHIEQMGQQDSYIRTISSSMQRVAENSTRVDSSIEHLAKNLETLGSIYGNVLNAMNPPHRQ